MPPLCSCNPHGTARGGGRGQVLDSPLQLGAVLLAAGARPAIASRIGEGVAAGLLLAWLYLLNRDPLWMTWIPLGGSVLWLLLTLAMRASRGRSGLAPSEEVEYRSDLPIPDG
ncbi:MAG: hypothetical protein FJW20_24525 [Acidimicrobiia bacterium]|nr:hypothetical protein [Acidimicrobiia bacterium]